jgi:putative PIN family toxin of toxin-antitoxin system
LEAVRFGKLDLVQSPALWREFLEVLARPKFATRLSLLKITPTDFAEALREHVTWVADAQIPMPPMLRDHKDLIVLAAAVGARADAIVTGDEDLLIIKVFEGIPILTAREALRTLGIEGD